MATNPDYILNPATGKSVLRTGKVGKEVLRNQEAIRGSDDVNIVNPETGRVVLKSGKIGKEIMKYAPITTDPTIPKPIQVTPVAQRTPIVPRASIVTKPIVPKPVTIPKPIVPTPSSVVGTATFPQTPQVSCPSIICPKPIVTTTAIFPVQQPIIRINPSTIVPVTSSASTSSRIPSPRSSITQTFPVSGKGSIVQGTMESTQLPFSNRQPTHGKGGGPGTLGVMESTRIPSPRSSVTQSSVIQSSQIPSQIPKPSSPRYPVVGKGSIVQGVMEEDRPSTAGGNYQQFIEYMRGQDLLKWYDLPTEEEYNKLYRTLLQINGYVVEGETFPAGEGLDTFLEMNGNVTMEEILNTGENIGIINMKQIPSIDKFSSLYSALRRDRLADSKPLYEWRELFLVEYEKNPKITTAQLLDKFGIIDKMQNYLVRKYGMLPPTTSTGQKNPELVLSLYTELEGNVRI